MRSSASTQRLWVFLSARRKFLRRPFGYSSYRQRNRTARDAGGVRVKIINAVTGEVTSGTVRDKSLKAYKKWLSYKNSRAEVENVVLKRRSTFSRMSEDAWADFPIIIQAGSTKASYVVHSVEDKSTFRGVTTCTLRLHNVGNISYIGKIAVKKNMSHILLSALKKELSEKRGKPKSKKRAKRKRVRKDFDDIL